MSSKVAYYRNGAPYDDDDCPCMLVTSEPTKPDRNPTVFVNWPKLSPVNGGLLYIDYQKNRLPFMSYGFLKRAQISIDDLIKLAEKSYPNNIDQVRKDATDLLIGLKKTEMINDPKISILANDLQDALNALNTNVDLKIKAEREVSTKSAETRQVFNNFLKKYSMGNLRDAPTDVIDVAMSLAGPYVYTTWERSVTPKYSKEIEVKNNLTSYLDRIKITHDDIIIRKAELERQKKFLEDKARKEEQAAIVAATQITANFYKELTEKLGEQFSGTAKELTEAAKGKKIRNIEQALASFDKYNDVLNKKFSMKDREAIAKALESMNYNQIANNLKHFSKAFNYTGKAIDFSDVVFKILPEAIRTGNYRPVFLKLETMVAGRAATAMTAFAFSILLGTPMGILGYALIMTLASALIDEVMIEKFNKALGL